MRGRPRSPMFYYNYCFLEMPLHGQRTRRSMMAAGGLLQDGFVAESKRSLWPIFIARAYLLEPVVITQLPVAFWKSYFSVVRKTH